MVKMIILCVSFMTILVAGNATTAQEPASAAVQRYKKLWQSNWDNPLSFRDFQAISGQVQCG